MHYHDPGQLRASLLTWGPDTRGRVTDRGGCVLGGSEIKEAVQICKIKNVLAGKAPEFCNSANSASFALLPSPWGTQGGLEVVPGLVLRLSGREVVLQEGLQVLKGGPLLCVLLPALQHQLMQRDGAVLGARHPVAPFHLLQYLTVVHAWRGGGDTCTRGWRC